MWWFNKKEITPVDSVAPRSSGFFTTDAITRKNPIANLSKLLAKTFQKTISDFDVESGAMDSAADIGDSVKARFGGGLQGVPEVQLAWYASQGFIGYQACAMIAQHWLVDKACSMTGEDAVRNGYEVTVDSGDEANAELLEAIKKSDKRHDIRKEMESFVRMGRIFGIRHVLFLVDSPDPDYYTKPFNPDGVTRASYRGISQIDPYWITPELDAAAAADPASKHFYEPTFWRVNGKRIHRTHFVIFRNGELPDVLKPSYMYGGMPVTQRIYERVYASERCANESPQLLLTKRATIIHVDMDKVVANPALFEDKMTEWAYYRDNYGIKAVGQEEVIEQFDTALADLDATIMTQYQLVAAIAGVPATKLLGTSPKGFNATGEYEESSYHETLEGVQTHVCGPLLARHHLLAMRSDIAPSLGIEPIATDIKWEPLDSQTAKEEAETNLIKSQTGLNLVQSGAIDGADERQRVTVDKNSGYSGLAEIDEGDLLRDEENATTAFNKL